MSPRHTVHHRIAVALASLSLGAVGLTACAGSTATEDPGPAASRASSPAGEGTEARSGSGLPPQCTEAFPVAAGAPDPAEVSLMPTGWPAAEAPGTLCQTTATPDGTRQSLEYATDLPADEVLDRLEAALPPSYGTTRNDHGLGDQLDGSTGDVSFTVTTRPGAYAVAFGTD